eukprot:m.341234 g.341234  ORF g.341234 m.341234 type:complete len:274 (+) comp19938_c0_seq1:171-992(+)
MFASHLVLAVAALHVALTSSTNPIRVALYIGDGTTERARTNTKAVLECANSGIVVTPVNASMIRNELECGLNYDVVYFPGGGGDEQASTIGTKGLEQVRRFLSAGCGYVGVCAGAYLASRTHLGVTAFYDEPRPQTGHVRGDGNCTLQLTSAGSQVLGKFGVVNSDLESTLVFYANGPVMKELQDGSPAISNASSLVTFTSDSVPIEKHYKGPYSGQNATAVGFNHYNLSGRVLVSGPHPETNPLNFPKMDGPSSACDSVRAKLLRGYVYTVA